MLVTQDAEGISLNFGEVDADEFIAEAMGPTQ